MMVIGKQLKREALILSAAVTLGAATVSPAATLTSRAADDGNWETAANWDSNSVPVDGDSVVLVPGTGNSDITMDSAFSILSGQSLTVTGANVSANNPELALDSSAILTLATGGSMDIAFMRPRYASGSQFVIHPDASLETDVFSATVAGTVKFVTDLSSVTVWTNSGDYNPNNAVNLDVDLSAYDVANGTTLVLVDYGSLNTGRFSATNLTAGWTATLDYAYDADPAAATNLTIALTGLAPPVVWDNGGTGSGFATPTNWVGDVAPISGADSVVLDNSKGVAQLTTEYRIGPGKVMVAQNSPANDLVLQIKSGGNLIVGTGGTLDLLVGAQQGGINEGGGGETFTVEAGATVRMYRYWNHAASYINKFIADAAGVTTFEIENNFVLRGTGSVLGIDLSSYDIANGTTLVLFDYGNLILRDQAEGDNGFGTVKLTSGWTADLDCAYDQGGGDLAIALTNIVELPKGMVFTIR